MLFIDIQSRWGVSSHYYVGRSVVRYFGIRAMIVAHSPSLNRRD